MILSHRPATLRDFTDHHGALAPFYGPHCCDLAQAWAGILAHETVWSLVIEDVEGPPRPLSLSLSVFVSDRFADRLESGGTPWISGQVAARHLARGDEPLSLTKTRAAHYGGGLNLVSLHTVALDQPPGYAVMGAVGDLRAQVSRAAFRGYRVNRCLREVFSGQALKSFAAGGWRVRTDYTDHFGAPAAEPSMARPFLMGVNREEVSHTEAGGARMSSMFVEYPIRLNLRRAHRELLIAAIDGLTDPELAQRLSLSASAVKKRWASIYAHVEGLIPGMPVDTGRSDTTRGVERRRHVLNYLRSHPEEFRPLVD